MKIVRCEHGHFYDEESCSECPQCAVNNREAKKKGLFSGIFRRKPKKSEPDTNEAINGIYSRANPETRDKLFYGGLESAGEILMQLSSSAFGYSIPYTIGLSYEIYLQTWVRTRDGLNGSPEYIRETLFRRFSNLSPRIVLKCVDQSLDIIYSHEPHLNKNAAINAMIAEDVAKNSEIQDSYLNDEEYGLVKNKPIFVKGYGEDKKYLYHLRAEDGTRLGFYRIGSLAVEGISGLVDAYQLLLPDQSVYKAIFICNYGARSHTIAPKGLIYERED